MKMSLTFKKQVIPAFIARTSKMTPSIDIRLNGEAIGVIDFNDGTYSDPKTGIRVYLQYHAPKEVRANNPKCRFVLARMEPKFNSAAAAKAWVEENIVRLLPNIRIYFTNVAQILA